MQHAISVCLSFDHNGEEAVQFYVDLFNKAFGNAGGGSKIIKMTTYGAEELKALQEVPDVPEGMVPGPVGSVKDIRFVLNGQQFLAVNGGGYFGKFHESVSIYVPCENQQQIDTLYNALAVGGELQPCGWVKDKWGLSWQITPHFLWSMDEDDDSERAQAVNKALYKMNKIDMNEIMRVWNGAQKNVAQVR